MGYVFVLVIRVLLCQTLRGCAWHWTIEIERERGKQHQKRTALTTQQQSPPGPNEKTTQDEDNTMIYNQTKILLTLLERKCVAIPSVSDIGSLRFIRLVNPITIYILARIARHARSVVASKKISLMISTNALYILTSVSGESPI